jgi:hypothetical protein
MFMEFTKSLPSNRLTSPTLQQFPNTRRLVLTLTLVLGAYLGGPPVKAQTATSKFKDRVIIQARRVRIVRAPAIARQFPDRKVAIVVYPTVSGLSDPTVLARLRSALDIKNIFGYSLSDYREDAWLTEFGYKVNYNADHLLDITFTQSGMGAYPDDHEEHLLFNLRDGNAVKALDVFHSDKLEALAVVVNNELQREIKQIVAENRDEGADSDARQSINAAYENLKFTAESVDEFSISSRGITFLYDAGFPHAIKALEPKGRYYFSYDALRDFIRADGLLGKFKR